MGSTSPPIRKHVARRRGYHLLESAHICWYHFRGQDHRLRYPWSNHRIRRIKRQYGEPTSFHLLHWSP